MSTEKTVDKNHIFQAMVFLIDKAKTKYPQFDYKISEDGKAIQVEEKEKENRPTF